MKLSRLLMEHLKKQKQEKPKPRSYFYISEAGKTPYEIFKSLLGKGRLSLKTRLLMKRGRQTHKKVCDCLEEMGYLKAREIKVGDSLFKGFVDAISHLPSEKPMALEIKTVGPKQFQKILDKDRPAWRAYAQLQLYLNYLRKADKGRILFIEANPAFGNYPLESFHAGQRMKEFIVRKNDRLIGQTIIKFRKLKEKFLKAGVMSK